MFEVMDKPHEECGVVGVFAPEAHTEVAQIAYRGMLALQHRGQHGAGLSVIDPWNMMPIQGYRGDEKVSRVVWDGGAGLDNLLPGAIASVGHTRYTTNGGAGYDGCQPFNLRRLIGAHNGNIHNAFEVGEKFGLDIATMHTDSHCAVSTVAAMHETTTATDAVQQVAPYFDGAYSFVFTDGKEMVGARDPWGYRPLKLGRLDGKGYVLASEDPALRMMGAGYVRDLKAGEILTIGPDGIHSSQIVREIEPGGGICAMEYIYFARPDGNILGRSVYAARVAMGRQLAIEHPVDADLVIGVPESGVPSAIGYSRESGIEYGIGFFKNPESDRSFMQVTQEQRRLMALMKLWPNPEEIRGKRLVVNDDSIVRGTMSQTMARMLRGFGAKEVHYRISSPRLIRQCFFGMDIGDTEQLLANRFPDLKKMEEYLEADSVRHLSIGGTKLAIRGARPECGSMPPVGSICMSCMTNRYATVPPSYKSGGMPEYSHQPGQ